MDRIWNNYKTWLLKFHKIKQTNYTKLIDQLLNSPFEVVVERDRNRVSDAMEIRGTFFVENGINGDFYNHPISVFEVLSALAERIDREYTGYGDHRSDILFWEMIHNLGLDKFTDNRYNSDAVYNILGVWISRNFDKNGQKSPFPIPKTHTDQRKNEMWFQILEYVSAKNY